MVLAKPDGGLFWYRWYRCKDNELSDNESTIFGGNTMKQMLTITLVLACLGAQAEVIDRSDYTKDTATGLRWLDVTRTCGL